MPLLKLELKKSELGSLSDLQSQDVIVYKLYL
jgi:hypothetical protein